MANNDKLSPNEEKQKAECLKLIQELKTLTKKLERLRSIQSRCEHRKACLHRGVLVGKCPVCQINGHESRSHVVHFLRYRYNR